MHTIYIADMQKVVVIDDEDSGRTLIKQYLVDFPQLIVVGEANNGVDAIKVIRQFQPDIIFLDIQMPGLSGFEVLTHLDEIPHIIFSTAYDQYALQAFDVHAVDYLLKPYTRQRFHTAIKKLKTENSPQSLQPLAESLLHEANYPEKILVQRHQKLIAVPVKDILRIEASGDYALLITLTEQYLSNYGITQLESKLSPKHFIRVHRSAVVQLDAIREVHKNISSFDIVLINGDIVRVSRSYMENFKKYIY